MQVSCKLTNDRAAAVSPDISWIAVNSDTPIGVKMLLINESSGIATVGKLNSTKEFWTHWHPLPTFDIDF